MAATDSVTELETTTCPHGTPIPPPRGRYCRACRRLAPAANGHDPVGDSPTPAVPPSPAPTGWRQFLRIHPACNALPLLSPNELRELADDIKRNGPQQPILVVANDPYGDRTKVANLTLIDGRNRLDALELLGRRVVAANGAFVDGVSYRIEHGPADAVAAKVVALNIRRRHLTPEQRVDLALKILQATNGAAPMSGEPSPVIEQAPVVTKKTKAGLRGSTPSLVGTVAKMAEVDRTTARKHLADRGVVPKRTTKASPAKKETAETTIPAPAPKRSPRQEAGIVLQRFSDHKQLQAALRVILDRAGKLSKSYPERAHNLAAFFHALGNLAAAEVK
jgi:hypothetical protein